MSIHLRFEMDMLAFTGCIDIFTPQEQKILIKYRKENFAEKELVYKERRVIGKCPLTPEEYFLKAQFHYTKNQYANLPLIIGITGSLSLLTMMPLLAPKLGEKKLLTVAFIGSCMNGF